MRQKAAAQRKRYCAVSMMSFSGGIAGRRNIFWNSKTRGAPLMLFSAIVISCVFVGTGRGFFCPGLLENALVVGLCPTGGASAHFSICNVLSASFIEMIITICTSPSELMSHHLASCL